MNVLSYCNNITDPKSMAAAMASFFNSRAMNFKGLLNAKLDDEAEATKLSLTTVQVVDEQARVCYMTLLDYLGVLYDDPDHSDELVPCVAYTAEGADASEVDIDTATYYVNLACENDALLAEVLDSVQLANDAYQAGQAIRETANKYIAAGSVKAASLLDTVQTAIRSGDDQLNDIIATLLAQTELLTNADGDYIDPDLNAELYVGADSTYGTSGAAAWLEVTDLSFDGFVNAMKAVGKIIAGSLVGLGKGIVRAVDSVREGVIDAFVSGDVFDKPSNPLYLSGPYDACPVIFDIPFRYSGIHDFVYELAMINEADLTNWRSGSTVSGDGPWCEFKRPDPLPEHYDERAWRNSACWWLWSKLVTGSNDAEKRQILHRVIRQAQSSGRYTNVINTVVPGGTLSMWMQIGDETLADHGVYFTASYGNPYYAAIMHMYIIFKPLCLNADFRVDQAEDLGDPNDMSESIPGILADPRQKWHFSGDTDDRVLEPDVAVQYGFTCGARLYHAFVYNMYNYSFPNRRAYSNMYDPFGTVYIDSLDTRDIGALEGQGVLNVRYNALDWYNAPRNSLMVPVNGREYFSIDRAKFGDVFRALNGIIWSRMNEYTRTPSDYAAPYVHFEIAMALIDPYFLTAPNILGQVTPTPNAFWPYIKSKELTKASYHVITRDEYATAFARGLRITAAVIGAVALGAVVLKLRKKFSTSALQYKAQADALLRDPSDSNVKRARKLYKKSNLFSKLGGTIAGLPGTVLANSGLDIPSSKSSEATYPAISSVITLITGQEAPPLD